MKLLIVSSPTGGHFYPAIEVAKKLVYSFEKIIFVTQKNTRFIEIIKQEIFNNKNIVIEEIQTAKFLRKNPFSLIKFFLFFILSFLKSIVIFIKHKPNVIFSTGGYTSVPVILSLKLMNINIPIILHEQNCVFSMTNKFLNFFSKHICLGFDIKKGRKYIYTGNPLREKFYISLDKEKIYEELFFKQEIFTIFIFGGSQGARSINDAMLKIFKSHIEKFKDIQIIHITGFNDFEKIKKEYENLSLCYRLFPYSQEIEKFYTIADLVVARAGAMTISELIYFKKPAILIPLPTAAELHQNWNAEFLRRYNCAEVVYQIKNWEEKLYNKILELIRNKEVLYKMSLKYNNIPKPQTSIEKVIKNIYTTKN